jgi:transposase-like protein
MDRAGFVKWLAGIARLDPAQRGRVFQELALAAATDPRVDHAVEQDTQHDAAISVGSAAAVTPAAALSAEDWMAQVGHERIVQFGCPHCDADEIRPWGKAGGKPRYRCKACQKTFNPLTGTPLAGLHHQDRWRDQAQALIAGEAIAQAAKRCKVAYTTAFRWRPRFLCALNFDKPPHLSGIVEADETFILESFKGKRAGLPRAARKRGGKAAKRGLSAEQIPVMGRIQVVVATPPV